MSNVVEGSQFQLRARLRAIETGELKRVNEHLWMLKDMGELETLIAEECREKRRGLIREIHEIEDKLGLPRRPFTFQVQGLKSAR